MNLIIKTSENLPLFKSINSSAIQRVSDKLPEIEQKIKYFDRSNSQSTLAMMTLTMLNGTSPMRMLRQIAAEISNRKEALAEAQLTHAKMIEKIKEMEKNEEMNHVEEAELRLAYINLDGLESKVNGAIKDIATLIDAHENIKEKNGIEDWDEEQFEEEEKRHHVRRGFELLYRNLIQGGRPSDSTIEYMQQYGVHVQVALHEVSAYIQHTEKEITEGKIVGSNTIEDFLDNMADKYKHLADQAAERLFGKADFANKEYMIRNIKR